MKPGRIFWGVFLLVLGALLMIDRLTSFQIQFSISWKLWPILLILWGVGLVAGGKVVRGIMAAIAGAFLALLLASAWWGDWYSDTDGNVVSGSEQVFHEQFTPTIKHAAFTLESGAGTFRLRDTSTELLTADTKTSVGSYRIDRTTSGSDERLSIRYEGPMRAWGMGRMQNSVDVRLHPDPSWELTFNVGATHLDVDATPYNTESVNINAGAADVMLKLGSRAPKARVSVSTGASTVRILVPASSGCEVHATAPLSLKDFQGFKKNGSGWYETENFGDAPQQVSIDISAGVSSIRILRY